MQYNDHNITTPVREDFFSKTDPTCVLSGQFISTDISREIFLFIAGKITNKLVLLKFDNRKLVFIFVISVRNKSMRLLTHWL